MSKSESGGEAADKVKAINEAGERATQRAAATVEGAARGGEGGREPEAGRAPQAGDSEATGARAGTLARAGRSAIATGAAARDDAAGPQGSRYVVASKSQYGYRRDGHYFGNTPAVYTLSQDLADKLEEQGQVVINPYNARAHAKVVVVDDEGAPPRDVVDNSGPPGLTPAPRPPALGPSGRTPHDEGSPGR